MFDDETLRDYASLFSDKKELIRATKGFMPPAEGIALARSLDSCPLDPCLPAVEIGSYAGLSAIYLGTVAKKQGRALICVDHHHGSEENQPGWEFHDPSLVDPVSGKMDTLYLLRRSIELSGLSDTVIIVAADSHRFASVYDCRIAFLFIDGGHGFDQAHSDYRSWVPKLASGGYLAVHDVFDDPESGGQVPLLLYRKALEEGFVDVLAQGSLRVMRKA